MTFLDVCNKMDLQLNSKVGGIATLPISYTGGDYMALKRMSIKVAEEMHDWLKVEADKRGLTMNAIIIFALENYYRETIALPNIQKAMDLLEEQKNKGFK